MSLQTDTLQSLLYITRQVGTVTYLTVRQAAERVGISRQTMFRQIKDGRVSATLDREGQKQIDIAELIRVFGNLKSLSSKATVTTDRSRLTQKSEATAAQPYQVELEKLRVQLEFKEAELALAKERISELKSREHQVMEEKNRLLTLVEQQSRLLAAPPSPLKATKVTSASKLPTARMDRKPPVKAAGINSESKAPTKKKAEIRNAP